MAAVHLNVIHDSDEAVKRIISHESADSSLIQDLVKSDVVESEQLRSQVQYLESKLHTTSQQLKIVNIGYHGVSDALANCMEENQMLKSNLKDLDTKLHLECAALELQQRSVQEYEAKDDMIQMLENQSHQLQEKMKGLLEEVQRLESTNQRFEESNAKLLAENRNITTVLKETQIAMDDTSDVVKQEEYIDSTCDRIHEDHMTSGDSVPHH